MPGGKGGPPGRPPFGASIEFLSNQYMKKTSKMFFSLFRSETPLLTLFFLFPVLFPPTSPLFYPKHNDPRGGRDPR